MTGSAMKDGAMNDSAMNDSAMKGLTGSLRAHAVALALVLVALVPLMDSYAPASPDEGLYSTQAHALSEGSWSMQRPAPDVDPDGRFTAFAGTGVDGDRMTPYALRPVYPLLLTPFYAVAGHIGLLVASVAGTWCAAVGAALLAQRVSAGHAMPALWLAGIGTPLLFDAYLVIGHSIAAALCAALALAVANTVDDRRTVWLTGVAASAAALVLVRSEGTLVVAAMAAVLALTGLPWRTRAADASRLAAAVTLVLAGGAAFLANHGLARWVSDGLQQRTGSVASDQDPFNVVWVSLLRPWYADARTSNVFTVLSVVAVVGAFVAARLAPRFTLLPLALGGMGAVAAVAQHTDKLSWISGLLPAFPLLAAVIMLRREDLRRPLTLRLAGTAALAAVAITLTVYGVGGATEWGGRFYAALLPLLVPLVVLGGAHVARDLGTDERRFAAVAVGVLVVALGAYGLRVNHDQRSVWSELAERSEEFTRQHSTADEPLLVVTTLMGYANGRMFWRAVVEGQDVLATATPRINTLLPIVRLTDRPDMIVVADVDPGSFGLLLAPTLNRAEWTITHAEPLGQTGFMAARLAPLDDG